MSTRRHQSVGRIPSLQQHTRAVKPWLAGSAEKLAVQPSLKLVNMNQSTVAAALKVRLNLELQNCADGEFSDCAHPTLALSFSRSSAGGHVARRAAYWLAIGARFVAGR